MIIIGLVVHKLLPQLTPRKISYWSLESDKHLDKANRTNKLIIQLFMHAVCSRVCACVCVISDCKG